MPSVKKDARRLKEMLPIIPSKGNAVDAVHHKLGNPPSDHCLAVIQRLVQKGEAKVVGPLDRPKQVLPV